MVKKIIYTIKFFLLVPALNLLIFAGCSKEKSDSPTREDSLRVELKKEIDSLQSILDNRAVYYTSFISKNGISYHKLLKKYGEKGADIILSINRIDRKNLKRNDTLIIPDTIFSDFRIYSPFPFRINDLEDVKKIFFVSQTIQAFAAYEYGNLVRWGPASTGKKSTPTPNGLFHTNWKAKETISTFNDEWLLKWAFNISNFDGVSIHEYEMPGFPASHSCVRLLAIDAKWFYYWGEQWIVTVNQENILAYGTPVIIFGKYNFDSSQPWKALLKNPASANISIDELEDELDEYIDDIIDRLHFRENIIKMKGARIVKK